MANSNRPSGLTPVRYLNGAPWNGAANWYHIDSGDTNAFYPGDIVALKAGTATVAGEDLGYQTITVGNANGTNVGAIVAISGSQLRGGPAVNPTDLTKVWRPGATTSAGWFALVADDPNIIFRVQEGGTGTPFTVTSTSKNAILVLTAPATGVFVSGHTIDNGTAANTTSTYTVKLLGLVPEIDVGNGLYNTYGLYAKWYCLINNHYYRTGVAGI